MARRPWSLVARAIGASALVLVAGLGCRFYEAQVPDRPAGARLPGQPDGVFTTARPTAAHAVREFFGRIPAAEQPLEFPHSTHAARDIGCTDYCHEGAATGPVAGLPSVRTCMICHVSFATDRPRIQQITQMHAEGIDLAWQRVYGYPPEAHVRFNHAPHVRAGVDCATCHGPIDEQTVAQRNVTLTMGVCVTCHTEQQASIDCMTCHY
jgi:hypothetical protein